MQQDLAAISSDTSNDPDNLFLDGTNLKGDAQATLDPNYDPPPADNADWVTAMNDYVTAGEDFSDDNTNEQDNNPDRGQPGDHGRKCGPEQFQRRQRRGTERDHPAFMIRGMTHINGTGESHRSRRRQKSWQK